MIQAKSISIDRFNETGTIKFSTSNVSFTVKRGEIVSFVGSSGSGKTTIAELLSGFLKPITGEIVCDNQKVSQPQSQISLVLQDYRNAVFPWLNVRDNLELGYYKPNSNTKKSFDFQKVVDLLGFSKKQLSEYPYTLSGGQIQKVQIGRALISGTDFLILDEPTSSLDMKFREELLHILIKLKDNDFGILLITHHIDEAVYIGNRIYMSRPIDTITYEISDINGYNHCTENIAKAQNDEKYIGIFQCVYYTIFGN